MKKTKWQIWKESNKEMISRPWDFINPKIKKVSNKIAKERYDICLSCDKLILLTKQCKECKCFMNLKTQLPHASCPIKKWSSIDAIN